jgi:hypothetical protein
MRHTWLLLLAGALAVSAILAIVCGFDRNGQADGGM